MARRNRGDLFNSAEIGLYYCSNYCGGSRHLCAESDGVNGRRQWMFEMLQHFAQHFAIDIIGYCIQEDAFHLVLRNRPDIAERLRDDQAARAWLMLCPKSQRRSFALPAGPPTDEEVNQLLWLPVQSKRFAPDYRIPLGSAVCFPNAQPASVICSTTSGDIFGKDAFTWMR